jgi:hypothetical protein
MLNQIAVHIPILYTSSTAAHLAVVRKGCPGAHHGREGAPPPPHRDLRQGTVHTITLTWQSQGKGVEGHIMVDIRTVLLLWLLGMTNGGVRV